MKKKLTEELVEGIEEILNKGSRAEVLIEQGRIVVVEIKRKVKVKNSSA